MINYLNYFNNMILNTNSITELAVYINDFMKQVKENNFSLIITVNEKLFKKLDEDFFYRIKNELNDEELKYVAADNEFIVNFENLKVIIKKES